MLFISLYLSDNLRDSRCSNGTLLHIIIYYVIASISLVRYFYSCVKDFKMIFILKSYDEVK